MGSLVIFRGFVLLVLFCATATGDQYDDAELSVIDTNSFQPKTRYFFLYEAQLSTGLGHSSNHTATQRFRALGHLDIISDETAVMQFDEFQAAVANDVDLNIPHELRRFSLLQAVKATDSDLKKLKLPVSFVYKDGVVKGLRFSEEDETSIENLKRGPLGLLFVTLETIRVGNPSFFEANVEGLCKVRYHKEQREGDKNAQLHKTIDFNNCFKRPQIMHTKFSETCGADGIFVDQRRLISETKYVYNFTLDSGFMLYNSHVASVYSFKALNNVSMGETFTTAKLKFYKHEIVPNMALPEKLKARDILEFSNKWDADKDAFQTSGDNNPFVQVTKRVDDAAALVKEIAKINTEKTEETFRVHELTEMLVRAIRMLDASDIGALEAKIDITSASEASILWNALALAGTGPSVQHLLNHLKKGTMDSTQLPLLLNTLGTTRGLGADTVDLMLSLCKALDVKEQPQARGTCFKTFGTMARFFGTPKVDQPTVVKRSAQADTAVKTAEQTPADNKKTEPTDPATRYAKEIEDLLKNAKDQSEILLALNVIANSENDALASKLMEIVNSNADSVVKMTAASAFQQLSVYSTVETNLNIIIMNASLATEVRIVAFDTLRQRQPTRKYLSEVAPKLDGADIPDQLREFVRSALDASRQTQIPCFQTLATDIAQLRPKLFQRPLYPCDSSFHKFERYDKDLDVGFAAEWRQVYSSTSAVPKALILSFSTSILRQKTQNLLELVVHFDGDNIDKDLAKVREWLQRPTTNRHVKRTPRAADDTSATIFSRLYELFFKATSNENQKTKSGIHLNVRINNKDSFYFNVDLNSFLEMLGKDGDLEISQAMETFLEVGLNNDISISSQLYDASRKIPTSIGVPLQVSGKAPARVLLNWNIATKFMPETGDVNDLYTNMDFMLHIAVMNSVTMEVWTPLQRTGIRVQQKLLINAALSNGFLRFDFETKQMSAKFEPPQSKKLLFAIDTSTSVFNEEKPKEVAEENTSKRELQPLVDKLKDRSDPFLPGCNPHLMLTEKVQPTFDFWSLNVPAETLALKNTIRFLLETGPTKLTSIGLVLDFEVSDNVEVIVHNIGQGLSQSDALPGGGKKWNATIAVNSTDDQYDRAFGLTLVLVCTDGCKSWRPIVEAEISHLVKRDNRPSHQRLFAVDGSGQVIVEESWSNPQKQTVNTTFSGDVTLSLGSKDMATNIELKLSGEWNRSSKANSFGYLSLDVPDIKSVQDVWISTLKIFRFIGLTGIIDPSSLTPLQGKASFSAVVVKNGSLVLEVGLERKLTDKILLLSPDVTRSFLRPYQQCHVSTEGVVTFEQTSYAAPLLPTCYVVVFLDCLTMSVVIRARKSSLGTIDVLINTQTEAITIESTKLFCLRTEVQLAKKPYTCGNARITGDARHFYIQMAFVDVRIDRLNMIIAVSSVFKTKSCGLCGSFNGESRPNAFLLPDGATVDSISELFKAHTSTVDGSSCTPAEENLDLTKYLRQVKGEIVLTKKSYGIQRDFLMCLSAPMNVCPEDSLILKSTTIATTFFCFNRTKFYEELSPARENFLATMQLADFTGHFSSFEEMIKVPTKCRRE